MNFSENMIRICLGTIEHLSVRSYSTEVLARRLNCSAASLRRAIRDLREGGMPIKLVRLRFNKNGKNIDQWVLEKKLQKGEIEAVVASLFLPKRNAKNLLEQANVSFP